MDEKMKKRPGKELDYGTEIAISLRSPKVAYEPARIVRIFNTVQLKNYTLSKYSLVLVSTLIISPLEIKNGTLTTAPVSNVAGFVPP